jgi:hypothetical protein
MHDSIGKSLRQLSLEIGKHSLDFDRNLLLETLRTWDIPPEVVEKAMRAAAGSQTHAALRNTLSDMAAVLQGSVKAGQNREEPNDTTEKVLRELGMLDAQVGSLISLLVRKGVITNEERETLLTSPSSS